MNIFVLLGEFIHNHVLAAFVIYTLINLITLIVYAVDKTNGECIPEAVLLALAWLFGSVGALAVIEFGQHKIYDKKFTVGVPIALMLQYMIVGISGFCAA